MIWPKMLYKYVICFLISLFFIIIILLKKKMGDFIEPGTQRSTNIKVKIDTL